MKTLLSTTALLLVAVTAFAAPVSHSVVKKHAAKSAAQTWPATCPITGDSIASAKDAAGSSTYKGKTYYFCCSGCKPQFDKNPAKFVKSASAGKKGASHSGMSM